MKMGGQSYAAAALPTRQRPDTGGRVGLQTALNVYGGPLTPTGVRNQDRPTRSESLYRVLYQDRRIRIL
jgi:hypothetical protein